MNAQNGVRRETILIDAAVRAAPFALSAEANTVALWHTPVTL
jgi:hypothetical protein